MKLRNHRNWADAKCIATIVCIIGYLALGGLLLFDVQYLSQLKTCYAGIYHILSQQMQISLRAK